MMIEAEAIGALDALRGSLLIFGHERHDIHIGHHMHRRLGQVCAGEADRLTAEGDLSDRWHGEEKGDP